MKETQIFIDDSFISELRDQESCILKGLIWPSEIFYFFKFGWWVAIVGIIYFEFRYLCYLYHWILSREGKAIAERRSGK